MDRRVTDSAFLLLLPPSLVLLLYSYLGFFSRLMADDFCTFNDAQRFKMLRFIWHWYNNWGGRYSAIATDELLDEIGALGVRYAPLIVILIWTVISSWMCHQILQKTLLKRVHPLLGVALGTSIVFTAVSVSPGITKVLFWWNGMRTYIPPLISISFHIACLFWAIGRFQSKRLVFIASLVSFMIALFSGGYNETFTVVQFMGFTSVAGFYILTKRTRSDDGLFPLLTAATVGALLSLAIMVMSPGAARRQDIFISQPLDIPTIFEITIAGYFEYIASILRDPNRVTAVAALIFMALWAGGQSMERLPGKWQICLILTGGIVISFASLLPSAYGLGTMPALRTFTVPTFVLILSFGYGGLLLGKSISGDNDEKKSNRLAVALMLCAVFFSFLSSWLNFKTLYDQRGMYIEYASQWDDADAQIKKAKLEGAESVTIPATNNWARLDQPNQNPKYWATRCYSEFYGIQVYGPP